MTLYSAYKKQLSISSNIDKIAVDDKEFTGWHRVVANTYLSRMLAS